MKTARATLRALPFPDLAPGCKRFEVDCGYSTTGLTWVPGPVDLSDEHLTLMAAYTHQERCGACSVGDVVDRGDQRFRAMTEEAWSRLQVAAMRQRRN